MYTSSVRAEAPTSAMPSGIPQRRPPLSPKQQFQSYIRQLESSSGKLQEDSDHQTSDTVNIGGLQHVSSLRVQPPRSHTTLPRVATRPGLNENKHNTVSGYESLARTKSIELDLVAEERAAWSRQSPKLGAQELQLTACSQNECQHPASSVSNTSIVLEPPVGNPNRLPQPRKRQKQDVALKPFEALVTTSGVTERPTTSHGPKPGILGWRQDSYTTDKDGSDNTSNDSDARRARRSKFLEGSMNERSIATASSWQGRDFSSGEETSLDTDSDATPRASRSILSPQGEGQTAKTPATVKRRMFRLRSNKTSSENSDKVAGTPPRRTKKGLRKSISTWNFHNLGEKMRIFGGSTTDLTPKAANRKSETATNDPIEILNERKRKAEEAYAAQFGLKKHKSNSGLSTSQSSGNLSSNAPTLKGSTRSRRSISGGHTFTPSSTRARHSRTLSNSDSTVFPADPPSSSIIDLRKRPSRSELLKENQQLREQLRRTENQGFARSMSMQVAQELMRQRGDDAVSISPDRGSRMGGSDGVPPVPSVPQMQGSRPALRDMGNARVYSTGSRQAASGSLRNKTSTIKSRPVSMILEDDDEDEPMAGPREGGTRRSSTSREKACAWEWPEDVF